jgi:hypothetical protein
MIGQTVAELLHDHVGLDTEGIDRLHLLDTGRMTYDLRRLRLHGLIGRILRPGFSQLFDGCPHAPDRPFADAAKRLDTAFENLIARAKLAA